MAVAQVQSLAQELLLAASATKNFFYLKKNKTSPTANPPFHVSKLRLGESSYLSKLTEHS